MKHLTIFIFTCITLMPAAGAQNFLTKNGKVSFFSKTPLENIEAVNNQTVSILNSKTGEMAFSVLITGFLFKKAQMQEHFNENYLESTKYPKATFSGKISDMSKVNFTRDGTYTVTVNGNLTVHGITNKVSTPGTLTVKGKNITASSVFNILLADYKISIPKLVENNISKSIDIKVDCKYSPQ